MPWNLVDVPNDTALEKTGFPLSQRVPIAHSFWFEGVSLCPLPLSGLGLCLV